MSTLLLNTKLYLPQPQPGLIPRARLLGKLAEGLNRPCTLVSAPAGFGKTSLLSSWIRSEALPCVWVTLGQSDNDLGIFLSYIFAGLNQAGFKVDPSLLSLLQSTPMPAVEVLMGPLINQLGASADKLILVLDDYHLIDAKLIHAALNFLIHNQPANLHLVFSTRSDPPLELARLRANGQLVEIRAAELKFTLAETVQFLNQNQGLSLGEAHLDILYQKTEGWIAGLQLAALSLKGREDPETYIDQFSGSYDHIAAYFTDEILNKQTEQVQDFLIKTAPLDLLQADLCRKVTGNQQSSQILKWLQRNNLFLIALDDRGEWFRYHRLFGDLLEQRLLAEDPAALPEIYRQASEWFEEQGIDNLAVEYALRSDQHQRAARILERTAESHLIRSEIQAFLGWVERIPPQVLLEHEALAIYFAWAKLIDGGDIPGAASIMESLAVKDQHNQSRSLVVKSVLAFYSREIQKAADLCDQALAGLPESDDFFRNNAAWNLSALKYISGDHQQGAEVLRQVIQTSQASGNTLVAVIGICRLGLAQMQQGQLYHPRELFLQALELATDDDGQYLPVACEAFLGLGKVCWQWCEDDRAVQYLENSLQLSRFWKDRIALEANVILANIRQSQGKPDEARSLMDQASRIARKTLLDEYDDQFVSLHQAQLMIRQGDTAGCSRWVEARGLDQAVDLAGKSLGERLIRAYEMLVQARLLIFQDQARQAIKLLELILPELSRTASAVKLIEAELLLALAHAKAGSGAEALQHLDLALSQAAPEGFRRIFRDEISPTRELLESALQAGIAADFTSSILKTFPEAIVGKAAADFRAVLSERELEVLSLLGTQLSVPEIARRLYIATSTARSHIKQIYAKLEVHSRHEAVTKAARLGLL